MCIQNVVLFHHLLLKDRRAASSRVPYLSLNERKVGRALAPRRYEGLRKTDCQESVIPPFPQPLDATAYCNNSGHISRCGIFRARSTCTAPEPTRDHCTASADGGPSEALRTQTHKRGLCHNTDKHLPLLRALQLTSPTSQASTFPFLYQLLSLPAGSHLWYTSDACTDLCHAARTSSPPLRADSGRQALKNLSCSNAASTTTRRNSQLTVGQLRGCQLQQTCLELYKFLILFKKLPVEGWSSC